MFWGDGKTSGAVRWALGLSSALAITFCLLAFVNSLGLSYRPLEHRLTSERTMRLTLASEAGDEALMRYALAFSMVTFSAYFFLQGRRVEAVVALLGWLAGTFSPSYTIPAFAPVLIVTILALSYKAGLMDRLISGLLLYILALEVLSASYWLIYPFYKIDTLAEASQFQSGLFYLAGKFSPALALLLLFSWTLMPFYHRVARLRVLSLGRGGIAIRLYVPKHSRRQDEVELSRKERWLALLLAVGLSWLVVTYPYTPSLNQEGAYVSVDATFYESYLNTAMGLEGVELARYIFGNHSDRPLVVLLMYSSAAATGLSSKEVVKLFPLLLSALLVLSSYFAVVRVTYDQRLAACSALLSSTSVISVVGMYAGYYANWLAISMALLALGFAFGYVNLGKPSYLFAACTFLTLVELSHVWTWAFFCATLLALLFYHVFFEVWLRRYKMDADKAIALSLPVVSSFAVDMLKRFFFGVGSAGAEVSVRTATSGIRVMNLFLLSRNLGYMLEVFVGGLTSNALYLALATLAVILPGVEEMLPRLFSASLFVASFPFLLYDSALQSRLLYVLPIHLMAARGAREVSGLLKDRGLEPESKILLAVCMLSSVNYALRSSVNLV